MMPATLTAPRTVALDPAVIAELPPVALLLALYASDYVAERRPDPAKVAAFVVDGTNRLGLAELIDCTCHLVSFWQCCEDDTATSDVWAAYRERFDHRRVIHCTFDRARLAAVRRHLRAMATEAVAA